MGELARLSRSCVYLQSLQQLIRPEALPGQHLTHHTVHLRLHEDRLWGRVGRGISSPGSVADSTKRLRPAGTLPCGDASRPRCGSRTRPVPRRSSPSRIRFRCASGTLPRGPASPRPCLRGRWTGSSDRRVPKSYANTKGRFTDDLSRATEYSVSEEEGTRRLRIRTSRGGPRTFELLATGVDSVFDVEWRLKAFLNVGQTESRHGAAEGNEAGSGRRSRLGSARDGVGGYGGCNPYASQPDSGGFLVKGDAPLIYTMISSRL